jgi:nucleotidyltransferase/DNA polymerase involved in DNA repair
VAHWVLHVDLDQFLAAVEILRRPELRGRPVVVGGDGDPAKRGVVSTASYEARVFGVHSGLPLRTAARRCPHAVFLPVDREIYEAASTRVMATLREFGTVEELGWDEAFLAVDGDDPEAMAHRIQARVRAATGLACTVGIGQNRLQAKLATRLGKPAGVWGIGPKTAKRLAAAGIDTVVQLAAADPRMLAARFGPATGPWLVRPAGQHSAGGGLGIDRVVLAAPSASSFVGLVDLEYFDLGGGKVPSECGPVGAGALHPRTPHGTEAASPLQQGPVTGPGGGEGLAAQQRA